jgi:hypothetical protein
MKILRIYEDYFGAKEIIKPGGSNQRSWTSPLLSHLSAKSLVFTTHQHPTNEKQVHIQCLSISCGAADVSTI